MILSLSTSSVFHTPRRGARRRFVATSLLAGVLIASTASPALGARAVISPNSQSHPYGVASRWTLTFGSVAPYDADFYYGDGVVRIWRGRTSNTASASRTYYPCVSTYYAQTLDVLDAVGGYATDNSSTREGGGSIC